MFCIPFILGFIFAPCWTTMLLVWTASQTVRFYLSCSPWTTTPCSTVQRPPPAFAGWSVTLNTLNLKHFYTWKIFKCFFSLQSFCNLTFYIWFIQSLAMWLDKISMSNKQLIKSNSWPIEQIHWKIIKSGSGGPSEAPCQISCRCGWTLLNSVVHCSDKNTYGQSVCVSVEDRRRHLARFTVAFNNSADVASYNL